MWRISYWLLTGALIGFGMIAFLSIGSLFLLLGVILLVVGALRVGPRGIWAAIVGFGALPAGILIWDVTSAPWTCLGLGNASFPGVNSFYCVDTPVGSLTTYHVMALFFGLIALIGLAWPLARTMSTHSRSPAA